MFGVGKRHIRGYLGLLVGFLVFILFFIVAVRYGFPVGFLTTILPAFLLLCVYEWFVNRDDASGKNQPIDIRIHNGLPVISGTTPPLGMDDWPVWKGNIYMIYLVILTVLLGINLVGFMVFEKGIFLLGFIAVAAILIVSALFKELVIDGSDGHSYRDDHNPHLREWKDRLKKR